MSMKKQMKKKRYALIMMNDGGFPIIIFKNKFGACLKILRSVQHQHHLIINLKTDTEVLRSD